MRIAIFGTVGAGKTTLIKLLKSQLTLNYEVFKEPLTNNPYFEDSYSPDLNVALAATYKMEIFMLAARMKQFHESLKYPNVLYDRGVMDCIVFAHCNYATNRLSAVDWQVYQEYFENVVIPHIFTNNWGAGYDLIIYLKVSPEKSLERIQKRAIQRELNVDPQFWTMLVTVYNQWYEKFAQAANVLVVDGDVDDPEVYAQQILTWIAQS